MRNPLLYTAIAVVLVAAIAFLVVDKTMVQLGMRILRVTGPLPAMSSPPMVQASIPHPSGIDNTYYLYSANGEKIAEIDGPGSWVPVAMPTKNGTYLSFADVVKR